jgi:hypothetical protein
MESVINKSFIPSAVMVSVVAPFSLLKYHLHRRLLLRFRHPKTQTTTVDATTKRSVFLCMSDLGEKKKPAAIVDVFGVKIRLSKHCQGHQPAILI